MCWPFASLLSDSLLAFSLLVSVCQKKTNLSRLNRQLPWVGFGHLGALIETGKKAEPKGLTISSWLSLHRTASVLSATVCSSLILVPLPSAFPFPTWQFQELDSVNTHHCLCFPHLRESGFLLISGLLSLSLTCLCGRCLLNSLFKGPFWVLFSWLNFSWSIRLTCYLIICSSRFKGEKVVILEETKNLKPCAQLQWPC